MELFYFFLLFIGIAGAFYAFCCVTNVREQAWDLYCEMMKLQEKEDK